MNEAYEKAKEALMEARKQLKAMPGSREMSLAVTNLEQAAMWLAAAAHGGFDSAEVM